MRLLKGIAAGAGAVLAFSLANRRYASVAFQFAAWEVIEDWPLLAIELAVLLSLPIAYLVLRWSGFRLLSPRLLLFGYERWVGPIAVMLLVGGVMFLYPYARLRYRYFSETSFQVRAQRAFEERNFQKARSICTKYVSLYPHRAVGSAWPDPVCVPILRFTDDMGHIAAYIRRRPEAMTEIVDGRVLPFDRDVRDSAARLAWELAGNRVASDDGARSTRAAEARGDGD